MQSTKIRRFNAHPEVLTNHIDRTVEIGIRFIDHDVGELITYSNHRESMRELEARIRALENKLILSFEG